MGERVSWLMSVGSECDARPNPILAIGIKPRCLFPNILPKTAPGETMVVHQGSVLFSTPHVWIQTMVERKEHEEELAKAVSDARSKVNARRTSFPTRPEQSYGRTIFRNSDLIYLDGFGVR